MIRLELMKNIAKYAAISLLGLGIDFCIYFLLFDIGFSASLSNFVSSMLAFLSVWVISARTLFKTRLQLSQFMILFFYQTLSILGFSWLVGLIFGLLVQELPISWSAVGAKALTIPFSFFLNYAISRRLSVAKFSFEFRNQRTKLAKKKGT